MTAQLIQRLEDLLPGDHMFGPISGATGLLVGVGQLALREGFRMGQFSIRHAGIVVQASRHEGPSAQYPTGVITAPRLAQAMPHGAQEIPMRLDTHWTPRHAYVRLPQDYPGQADDAAHIARLMVQVGVDYSFASYLYLSRAMLGADDPRLYAWVDRRRAQRQVRLPSGRTVSLALPREAICSVFNDQAWTLAGKSVVTGTRPQVVTPGGLARALMSTPGAQWWLPGENRSWTIR